MAVAAVLTAALPAGAGTGHSGPGHGRVSYVLSLRAMPAGTISFGRRNHGRLTVRVRMFGLTPGSAHHVDLVTPGRSRTVRFSTLTASGTGQADGVLQSSFAGLVPRGARWWSGWERRGAGWTASQSR